MLGFNPFLQNVPGAGFWPGQMAQDPRLAFMQRRQMPMAQPIQATPFATPPAVARAPFLMPPHQTQVPQPGAIGRALAGPQQGTQTPQASQSAANGQVVAPSQAAPQLTRPRVMPLGTQEERNAFYADRGVWASEMPEGTTFAPLGRPLRHSEPMAQSTFLAPADLPEPPAASETFSDMQAPPGPASLMPMPERQPRSRLQQFGLDVQDGLNRVGEAFTPERMDALALFTNLIDAGRAKWLGEWDDGRAAGWGAAADAIQTYQDRGEARDIREEERARAQAAEERAAAAEGRAAVEAKQENVRFGLEQEDAEFVRQQRAQMDAWINTQPEEQRAALRANPEVASQMMARQLIPADYLATGSGFFVRTNRETGLPEVLTNAQAQAAGMLISPGADPQGIYEMPLSEREQIDINLQRSRIHASRPRDPNDVVPMTTPQLTAARDRLLQSQDLLAAVQNFRTMVENASPNALLGIGSEGAALESAHRTLAMLAKGPAGLDLGALVGADFDILSGILGEPGNWRQFAQSEGEDGILARIDQFNNFAQTGQRRLMAQYSPWQDQLADVYSAAPASAGPDFSAMTDAQLTQQLENETLTDAQIDALEAEWARRRDGGGTAPPTATAPTAPRPQQTVITDLPRLLSPAEVQRYGIDLRGRSVGEVVTVNGARYRVNSPGRGQLSLQRID